MSRASALPPRGCGGPILRPDCPITASDLEQVQAARLGMLRGGYAPLIINSPWSYCCPPDAAGKAPLGRDWQAGHSPIRLLNPSDDTWAKAGANTGILLGFGPAPVLALDIDVEDRAAVADIAALYNRTMPPGALIRTRSNSARCALILRCAPDVSKLKVQGERGAVERLAQGQQIVVHGWHASGARLEWTRSRAPWTVAAADLPLASDSQVAAFLDAVVSSGVLGAKVDRTAAPGGARPGASRGPGNADLQHAIRQHPGKLLAAIRSAIADTGARGSGRHDLLVSVTGLLTAKSWPPDEILAFLAPLANGAFREGDWTEEIRAAAAHAAARRQRAIRAAFTN